MTPRLNFFSKGAWFDISMPVLIHPLIFSPFFLPSLPPSTKILPLTSPPPLLPPPRLEAKGERWGGKRGEGGKMRRERKAKRREELKGRERKIYKEKEGRN